tara:strand:- start:1161 stop:2126 length:966 start_codon:yes stop_codon:yes gene_type:complete
MNSLVTSRKTLQPQTMEEAIKFSEVISKSGLLPKDYQGKPANCLVAIQWGMELGLAPLQALQNIAVINGKPSVYGDSLLAMVRADDRCMGVEETQEGGVATCIVKRRLSDGSIEEVKRTFSMKQAEQAGLSNRPTWKAYPDRMLQHRARGNALRDAFPDVLRGIITSEEAQDIEEPKDVTPTQEAVAAPTIETLTQPKIEEAEVVQEPPTSQFDKILEGLSVVPEKGEDIVAEEFYLCVPNKEPVIFQQPLDYMDAYNDLLLKVVKASKLAPAQKRTKMKELEQANLETFKTIPEDMAKELKEKRIQYNKGLSIEERDNER